MATPAANVATVVTVLLSFPAMQRWIVKDFPQAGSLQPAGLYIDMPIFCQDQTRHLSYPTSIMVCSEEV